MALTYDQLSEVRMAFQEAHVPSDRRRSQRVRHRVPAEITEWDDNKAEAPPLLLDPIPRAPLAGIVKSFGSILAAHADCVAPGVAVREIRPPLTELSPMPANIPTLDAPNLSEPPPGLHLRQVLMTRPPPAQFDRRNIPRDLFRQLVRLTFRGGTYFPLHSDGPHVALVRPFFITHGITGLDAGIWYYHPPTDKWSLLGRGDYRRESACLAGDQPTVADASALCVMTANLHTLLTQGGPDLYRLAHLEAGLTAQRLLLACHGVQLAAVPLADVYDEEVRRFFGLASSHWEPVYAVAIGHVPQQQPPSAAQGGLHLRSEDQDWRG